MAQIEFKRGNKKTQLPGNLILGSSEKNIKAFRVFCKELGANAVFSQPLNSKSNLDFTKEEIIAYIEKPTQKLIKDLDKNENVTLLCCSAENFDLVFKNSNKPVIVKVNYKEIEKIPSKSNGILVHFYENEDINPDVKIFKKIKEQPILVQAKFEIPEDMYNLIKETKIEGIVMGDFAQDKPTIFEQAENYFEKGYYNKLTRKRREKVVSRFEELFSEFGLSSEDLYDYKQRFLEE
jgi:hypothetical protein